jgi:hypothetical protein
MDLTACRHKLIYSPAPELEKLLSNEEQQQAGNLLGPLAAIPKWARDTLISHAADLRPARKSAQQLERGTTGEAVWDAMQRQLVRTGVRHMLNSEPKQVYFWSACC